MDTNEIHHRLAQLGQRLEQDRLELIRQHQGVEHHQRTASEPQADPLDRAAGHDNDEVEDALDCSGVLRLRQIEAALQRLEAGTYGRCPACGAPIAWERLEILPHIATCAPCASEINA